jgi:hypothetical protein
METKQTLGEFTRKSVAGAVYRVGASFTMDALYISLVATGSYYLNEHQTEIQISYHGFSDFFKSLDVGKLARVTGFVIVINFADYKWDITNRLDKVTKRIIGLEKKLS